MWLYRMSLSHPQFEGMQGAVSDCSVASAGDRFAHSLALRVPPAPGDGLGGPLPPSEGLNLTLSKPARAPGDGLGGRRAHGPGARGAHLLQGAAGRPAGGAHRDAHVRWPGRAPSLSRDIFGRRGGLPYQRSAQSASTDAGGRRGSPPCQSTAHGEHARRMRCEGMHEGYSTVGGASPLLHPQT